MDAESVCARLNAAWAGRETEHNWAAMERCLRELPSCAPAGVAAAVRTHCADALAAALRSDRTRVALAALDVVTLAARQWGSEWAPVVETLLPAIVRQCERAARLVAERARLATVKSARVATLASKKTVHMVIGHLQNTLYTSRSPMARQAATEGIAAIMQEALQANDSSILVEATNTITAFISAALVDSAQSVRAAARQAFEPFGVLFPHRTAEVVAGLPPAMQRTFNQPHTVQLNAAVSAALRAESKPIDDQSAHIPASSAAKRILLTPIQSAVQPKGPAFDTEDVVNNNSSIEADRPNITHTADIVKPDSATAAQVSNLPTQPRHDTVQPREHTPAELRVFVEGVKSERADVRAAALNTFAALLRAAEDDDRVVQCARTSKKVYSRLFDILHSGLQDTDPEVSSAMQLYGMALLERVPITFVNDYDTAAAVARCLLRLMRTGRAGVPLAAALAAWSLEDKVAVVSTLQRCALQDADWTAAVCNSVIERVPDAQCMRDLMATLDATHGNTIETQQASNEPCAIENAHEFVIIDEEVSLRSSCSSLCLAAAHTDDKGKRSSSGHNSGQASVSAHMEGLSIECQPSVPQ